jgi:hypothetical protein
VSDGFHPFWCLFCAQCSLESLFIYNDLIR